MKNAIMGWLRALGGAVLLAIAALLAYRATRERDKALDGQSEDDLRQTAAAGTGDARRHARVALDRLKRAEAIEREARRKIDKGAKDANAEDILDRWRARANRL